MAEASRPARAAGGRERGKPPKRTSGLMLVLGLVVIAVGIYAVYYQATHKLQTGQYADLLNPDEQKRLAEKAVEEGKISARVTAEWAVQARAEMDDLLKKMNGKEPDTSGLLAVADARVKSRQAKEAGRKPADPAAKPVARPEVKLEPKPEPKPVARPEVKPEPKPEPKPVAQPEVKPEPKPEPKPVARPEVKPEPKPEPKPVAQPEVKPEPKPIAQPEVKVEPKPEPDVEVVEDFPDPPVNPMSPSDPPKARPKTKPSASLAKALATYDETLPHYRLTRPGNPDAQIQRELKYCEKKFREVLDLLEKARKENPKDARVGDLEEQCQMFLYDCLKRQVVASR